MLLVVRSPVTSLRLALPTVPAPVNDVVARLLQHPARAAWIVPSEHCRRQLLHDDRWFDDKQAAVVPRILTLKAFLDEAQRLHGVEQRCVSHTECCLRLARAWHDITGHSPRAGFVCQLEQFVSDWQRCGLSTPNDATDTYEAVVERFLAALHADGLVDSAAVPRLLVNGGEPPYGQHFDTIIFDSFHRFDHTELELIAALARRCTVLLWLTAAPGGLSWASVEVTVQHLRDRATRVQVIDHVPTATGLAVIGRKLFPARAALGLPAEPLDVDGLYRLEARNPMHEVEQVVAQIKAARAAGHPSQLTDVAIVIPQPEYEPLIRAACLRVGVPVVAVDQPLPLRSSRPARLLNTVLDLVRGQWRPDLVLDFLNQPLVLARLSYPERLYDFFQQQAEGRRQLDYRAWMETWSGHLRGLDSAMTAWENGSRPLPDKPGLVREEFLARQREQLRQLTELLASIRAVFRPVAAIEALSAARPTPNTPMRDLVEECLNLLATMRVDEWLDLSIQSDEAVPWNEIEQDRHAYLALLNLLERLARLPASTLPRTGKRVDVFAALRLALDVEMYRVPSSHDTGVQLLTTTELIGLRFRHVYVLGLVDGVLPPMNEPGAFLAPRRRQQPLAEQLWQREIEPGEAFRQLFEAATNRLVLSRYSADAHQKLARSSFLLEVEQHAQLQLLPAPALITGLHEAAFELGRASARATSISDLWPTADAVQVRVLEPVARALAWKPRWTKAIHIDAPALLELLFHPEFGFSPSQLELYAACPFRYFGSAVLKLHEREADQSRIVYGSMLHKVFQRFYEERRQQLGLADGPLPAVSTAERTTLVELFRGEWSENGDGTLSPHLAELFCCDGGIVDLFLDMMRYLEGETHNFGNVLVEHSLKEVNLGTDARGVPVLLTGTVDRVDVQRTLLQQAIILDYKTGRIHPSNERTAKAEDGRLLQLPLYAAALALALPGLQPVGGAYLHLNERKQTRPESPLDVIGATGQVLVGPEASVVVPFDPAAARRKALELATEIRAGNFSLTIHDLSAQYPECNAFCSLRHACRHPRGYAPRREQ